MSREFALRFNPHQEPGDGKLIGDFSTQEPHGRRTVPWHESDILYPGPHEALLPSIAAVQAEESHTQVHYEFSLTAASASAPATFNYTKQEVKAFINEPVAIPNRSYVVHERFQTLQRWEGVVLNVLTDTFNARLVDRTDPDRVDEEAEFFVADVAEADLPLLEEGAVFYWSIGYRNALDGQRQRVSEIRFRRLPAWSKKDIETAKQAAQRLKDIIGQ